MSPRAALLLTLLWLTAGFGCGNGPEEKTTGDSVAVEVNSRAPAFAAPTLQGATVRLADSIGTHVVLLEFWSTFCRSCLEEMPRIEALHARYAQEGLAVVSVNTDVFSPRRIASFLEKRGVRPPYPVVLDARQEVVGAYKVEVLPVTVIIDRSGWIRLYQEGYRPGDEKTFERKIRRLLGRTGDEDVTLAPRGGVTVFAPRGALPPPPGLPVAGLKARSLEGKEVALGRSGPCLLSFWSLFCAPCREEFPAVAALAQKFGPQGLTVYAVNVDSDRLEPRVRKFTADYPALPCLLDGSEAEGKGGLARTLGVRATPTQVLLDGRGVLVHSGSGEEGLPRLEGKIAALLAPKSAAKPGQ